jgi:KaiC/GvpD/RAD55 family RecA-like ATPase
LTFIRRATFRISMSSLGVSNEMNGGLIPTRMYGVGAETGIGKTVLLGSISENLNTQGRRHLHISLETPSEDIEIRNVARRMNVNAAQIYDSDQPEHQHVVNNADAYIAQVPDNTFFEWAPGATYDDIRRYIVHAIHKHGIEGVIIDYWQLIRGRERGQSEEGHMRDVANRLAALARRENIWILIAVQVDESGRVKISDSIKLACALYVRLMRAPNDTTAYFHTEKSNYTRLTDTGSASTPGMIFHHHGPHFGTPSPEDMTQIGDTPADAIDV